MMALSPILDRDLVTPPATSLNLDSGTALICERLVREVPGAREVFAGWMNEVPVFIKHYHAPQRAHVHFERERAGLAALAAAHIPAPELLHAGPTASGGYAIVTRALETTRSARACCEAAPDHTARASLLARLMDSFAALHRVGLVHGDPHLDNFLLTDDTVYLLDGAEVRHTHNTGTLLNNLALLCAQFLPDYDADACAHYTVYDSARRSSYPLPRAGENQFPLPPQGGEGAIDTSQLARAIAQQRERRLAKCMQKTLRDCTAFRVTRSLRGFVVHDRQSSGRELAAALRRPDQLIPAQGPFLKRGNTATVALAHFDSRTYVVKRYNIKSLTHRLSRAFRPTRAARSWQSAHLLSFFGIATPRPVALVEQRLGPLRGRAWFVSEYVEGAHLREYLRDETLPFEQRRRATESAVALINRMGRARISHGDFKATNLLVTPQGEIVVTDLDALRRHRTQRGLHRARARDLKRLLANWADRPDIQALFTGLEP
jgi:tRNA A-37 threonylcarbamoyl transferase component Bud32